MGCCASANYEPEGVEATLEVNHTNSSQGKLGPTNQDMTMNPIQSTRDKRDDGEGTLATEPIAQAAPIAVASSATPESEPEAVSARAESESGVASDSGTASLTTPQPLQKGTAPAQVTTTPMTTSLVKAEAGSETGSEGKESDQEAAVTSGSAPQTTQQSPAAFKEKKEQTEPLDTVKTPQKSPEEKNKEAIPATIVETSAHHANALKTPLPPSLPGSPPGSPKRQLLQRSPSGSVASSTGSMLSPSLSRRAALEDNKIDLDSWDSEKVLEWVASGLRYPQYVELFKNARFDGSHLKTMTHAQLQELGVKKKLHRTKILTRIKQLAHGAWLPPRK